MTEQVRISIDAPSALESPPVTGPPRKAALVVALVAVFCFPGIRAASASDLKGAWVQEPNTCTDVFATWNGRTVFRKGQALTLAGFIVDGKHIRGATTSCDVASTKDKGDTTSVLLNCRSQLMFGHMAVSMRVTGPDTLQRIDPNFPDIAETYHRCPSR